MDERTFEDIICKYPELIEDGLSFKGRQVTVEGKRVDVLFEDRHRQKLIVEIKKGTVRRDDIAQLLDYEGYFVSPDAPDVRVMLVGRRVPENLRRSLDHHGFEWREFPTAALRDFLRQKCDSALLHRLAPEEALTYDPRKAEPYSRGTLKHVSTERASGTAPISVHRTASALRDGVEQAVARIREECLNDPSFHSVRQEAEAKAKEMLNTVLGSMSETDICSFLKYMNTESIKGRRGFTRFGSQVTNINAKYICGCPHEFNEWIGSLWRTKEDAIHGVLQKFLMDTPIKRAGILLPTFVLYLRRPTAFNIYTEALGNNLARAFPDCQLHGENQHARYVHFNHEVFDLLVTPFHLKPEEIDLVLAWLPRYL